MHRLREPRRLRALLRKSRALSSLLAMLQDFPPTARLIAHVRGGPIQSLRQRAKVLGWSLCQSCPHSLYDASGAKVGDRLYIIRGYRRLGIVNNKILVFDLNNERWVETIDCPVGLAHSHHAVCSDGVRFIYVVSGQLGPQCHPAIADGFAFDTLRKTWRALPALPAPRYAGTMQLLGNRLHFVGGALPDRYTPASNHWSLAVEEGQAIEDRWRDEPPIPRPAMHRGSAAIGGSLYIFGGQQGDFIAIPGDANYTCTGETRETYLADTYRFRLGDLQWARLRDMLVPASHTDFSVVSVGETVHVVGGQIYKHPENFRLRLTDLVQTYDVEADRWSISGCLPYRLKLPVCVSHHDALYCTTGQRDQGSSNDSPGGITGDTWRIPLSSLRQLDTRMAEGGALPSLHGKEVVLITNEFSLSGAPLILIEAAQAMQASGATVRLFTLADDADYGNLAERCRLPVLPIETAETWAVRADLVIVNTTVAGPWIRDFLAAHPASGARLVWWNH